MTDAELIASLRQQLAAQAAQVAALEELRRENAALHIRIDQLLGLLAQQNERLSEVASILRRREDQLRRVPKAARPPDEEPDPPAAPPSPAGAGPTSTDSESVAPTRKKRKRGGRKPVAAHLPVDSEHVPVEACAHCGCTHLLARDTEVSRKYTAVAAYIRCREVVRDVVRCTNPSCGRTTTATMPPMPCDRSLFTCEFLAWLVVQRFVLLAPLDRIRRLLLSRGIDVPMATLVGQIALAAALVDAIDGEHWRQLRRGPVILTDGTGMKVLIEGQEKAWDGHLDVFSYGAVVVYLFAMTKHADEFAKLFADYDGKVVCDGESRIDAVFEDGRRSESNCNAHPRRKFRDAQTVQPVLARKAGRFMLAMYRLEKKAKQRGLSGDALLAWRQRRTRPIVDRFRAWLEQIEPSLLPSDPLGKAVRYYLRHFVALTAFVDDPLLPIDNNQSERLFQHHAKSRLNAMFAGSVEGAHRYATIAGVVASAQRQGLDVFAYFTWVFERRGTHRERFGLSASELTPAAYKQALEQSARKAA